MIQLRAGIVAMTCVVLFAAPAAAQNQSLRQPTMTVSGDATVTVTPDQVLLRAGVVAQGKTAREATEANAKAMAAVIAALRNAGIEERDIQTTRIALQPTYEQQQRVSPGRIIGFQVSNQVSVRLHDTGTTGETLDLMIGAGANEIGGVEFVVSEPSKARDEARLGAVADARRKAALYAKAAGVGLGRVMQINEDGGAPGPVQFRAERLAAAAPATPVMPGERTLHATVTVTFQILP